MPITKNVPRMALILCSFLCGCASQQKLDEAIAKSTNIEVYLTEVRGERDSCLRQLEELGDKDSLVKHYQETLKGKMALIKSNTELSLENEELKTKISDHNKLKQEIAQLKAKNNELGKAIEALSNPLSLAAAQDWLLAEKLQGSLVYAQDDEKTFLGIIDFNCTHPDSIFNEVGLHGSEVAIDSIWNDVGFYGSEVGLYSARNDFCINPPMIVRYGYIIGHISTNEVLASPLRADPYRLKAISNIIQGKR